MGRRRRRIVAGQPYELMIRARTGLPFVTTDYMKLLLESALARAQRDSAVTICHYVWMGNHAHVLFIPHDTTLAIKFYTELPKKITEIVKRLLGLEHLQLWGGRPIVAAIGDVDDVIDRIGYIYANPAKANLVDAIEDYPGLSTWADFISAPDTVDASSSRDIPWIRQPMIKALSSLALSRSEDRDFTRELRSSTKKSHTLTCYPNAWMKSYSISDPAQIADLKARAIKAVRNNEAEARSARKRQAVLGAEQLRREQIMKAHTPAPKERSVFILSKNKELRIGYIKMMDRFTEQCRICYRMATEGTVAVIPWPPGAIRPYLRPQATALR